MAFDPIMDRRLKDYTDKKTKMKRKVPVKTPSLFPWSNHPLKGKIFTDGDGIFSVENFDVSSYQITGKAYYVDLINGNDTNNGLTLQTAFQTPKKASQQTDIDVMLINTGYYQDFHALAELTRSISIKALPNADVTLSGRRILTWTKTVGQTNVYQANRSLTTKVYDAGVLDEYGDYTELISKASISEVNATPGSYYFNSTSKDVYVHTVDSRPADENIAVFLDVYNVRHSGDKTIYLEGLKIEGGKNPITLSNSGGNAPNLYAKDCTFKYASAGNGLNLAGVGYAFLQNCIASKNLDDGFNYGSFNGVAPKFIEIECVGRSNGATSDTDNGSTAHDGSNGIRINGLYYGNKGPNVQDVGNTKSWFMGCLAFESNAVLNSQNIGFGVSNNGATTGAISWLDCCIAYGNKYDVAIGTDNTGKIRNLKNGTESFLGTKELY